MGTVNFDFLTVVDCLRVSIVMTICGVNQLTRVRRDAAA